VKVIIIFLTFIVSNQLLAKFTFPVDVKSIYEVDDRELITRESPAHIQKLSESVAMIFSEDDLIDKDIANKEATILASTLSEKPPMGHNFCSSERFATHHAYKRGCSGFLIGKDILVTAGHCFRSKNDCHRKLIAFSVADSTEVQKGFRIKNEDLYSCSKIIAQAYDQTESLIDFAVIKLDRKTTRPILKFRQAKEINNDDSVFMIGHPLGLPLVYSKNAKILENNNEIFFKASLDSFHGNSGSPVFNLKNNTVEGILVRGEVDDDYSYDLKCNRYATYQESDLTKGEGVTKITAILPYIFNKFSFEEESLIELSPLSCGLTNGTCP
jgi:V8-like Glu-specific endopeptidase